MNKDYDEKINRKYWIFAILVITIWTFRLCFSAVKGDEVFNIYTSYLTAILKQRHLIENPFLHQTGNVWNIPLIWCVHFLTGKIDGIVLYGRVFYLALNIILAAIIYNILKNILNVKVAFMLGVLNIVYAPLSMYYLWYDTAALYFMLLGIVLFLYGSYKAKKQCIVLSGVFHACMVYSYPAMVLVVLTIIVGMSVKQKKNLLKYWMPYFVGLGIPFVVFLIYIISQGIHESYIFLPENIVKYTNGYKVQSVIEPNGRSYIVDGAHSALNVIGKGISQFISLQKKAIICSVPLAIQWLFCMKKKGWVRVALVFEIILIGAISLTYHRYDAFQWAQFEGYSFYAYLAIWMPFLYFLIEKREGFILKHIFTLFWIPSLACTVAIGFSAYYIQKASLGMYVGTFSSLIIMCELLSQEKKRINCKWNIQIIVLFLMVVINICLFYTNVFEGTTLKACNQKINSGIFRDLWVTKEDSDYEEIEKLIKEKQLKQSTIYYAWMHSSVLLMGDFISVEYDFKPEEIHYEKINDLNYWEKVRKQFPDLIVLDDKELNANQNFKEYIIDTDYDLILEKNNFYMWQRK